VLIIGSGGREHALAWACARSGLNADIFCAPGNGGTSSISTNIKLDPRNHTSILEFINDLGIDLTIIGPEQPLVDGLADAITASGYNVFGPSAACALIEGSKSWAKTIMIEVGVPTAEYGTFKELEGVIKYLDNKSFPIVVKKHHEVSHLETPALKNVAPVAVKVSKPRGSEAARHQERLDIEVLEHLIAATTESPSKARVRF